MGTGPQNRQIWSFVGFVTGITVINLRVFSMSLWNRAFNGLAMDGHISSDATGVDVGHKPEWHTRSILERDSPSQQDCRED